MLGLMYLGAAVLFLGVLLFVVARAWLMGRASGGSWQRGLVFATAGFLLVYLPVFWNLLPTVLAHKHYCGADAGFVVRVPAEQWNAAYASDVERIKSLPRSVREASSPSIPLPDGFRRSIYFDGLLASDFRAEQVPVQFVNLRRLAWRTVDVRTGVVLAAVVDYQTGTEGDVRFWLRRSSCFERPSHIPGAHLPLENLFAHDRILRGEKQ